MNPSTLSKLFTALPIMLLAVLAALYFGKDTTGKIETPVATDTAKPVVAVETPETAAAVKTEGTAQPASQVGDASAAATPDWIRSLATGDLAAVVVHSAPKPIPTLAFADAQGQPKTLADWKGRVVLLNLWATWCAPCREEMPDLSNLQRALGSKDFEVVALSVDRKGAEASSAFLKEVKADNLSTFVEPEGNSLQVLQALGLPATLLINRNGEEVARLLGPAEWSSNEAQALIKAVILQK
jgi:thiol-disulfide isomerase/thioredoxin